MFKTLRVDFFFKSPLCKVLLPPTYWVGGFTVKLILKFYLEIDTNLIEISKREFLIPGDCHYHNLCVVAVIVIDAENNVFIFFWLLDTMLYTISL